MPVQGILDTVFMDPINNSTRTKQSLPKFSAFQHFMCQFFST